MEDKLLKEIENQFTLAIKKKSYCETSECSTYNFTDSNSQYNNNTNDQNNENTIQKQEKKRKRGRPRKQISQNYLEERGNKIVDVIDVLVYKKKEQKDQDELKKIIKKRIQASSNIRPKKWTQEENSEFYQAIKLHGVDFSLIANEVKSKSYKQIQEKYNKEYKKNNKELMDSIEYFERLGKTFLTPKMNQNQHNNSKNPKNIHNLTIIKPSKNNDNIKENNNNNDTPATNMYDEASTDHIFPQLQLPNSAKVSTPSTIKFDINSPYQKDFLQDSIENNTNSRQNIIGNIILNNKKLKQQQSQLQQNQNKRAIRNYSEQNSAIDEQDEYQQLF